MVLIPAGTDADSFNQETNPFGAHVNLDTDHFRDTPKSRAIFVKLMVYQQVERNLRLKHIKLLDQLFNIKEGSAGLLPSILKKLGELHVIIKELVYVGKQEFLDDVMMSDDEDVKSLFQDDFFRQLMGVTKNRHEESETIYKLLPKFLHTRDNAGCETEEDRRCFAMVWLHMLEKKYPNWLYQTCPSSGAHPLWIRGNCPQGEVQSDKSIATEWCPEPPDTVTGDFIHPACFEAIIEDYFDGHVGDLVGLIVNEKCYTFDVTDKPIYRNLPVPLR